VLDEYVRRLIYVTKRAISLRTGSKQERIASGVSSTMISTPVAASKALMFLPRPIILPLTSSDSMLKTDTQFSTASSVPLFIVFMMIF
jgi:hypothetical protein